MTRTLTLEAITRNFLVEDFKNVIRDKKLRVCPHSSQFLYRKKLNSIQIANFNIFFYNQLFDRSICHLILHLIGRFDYCNLNLKLNNNLSFFKTN